MKRLWVLLLLLSQWSFGVPQYYCTGSNWAYFESLLNLIGSIHATNFDELQEIAVIDLGLKEEQIQTLQNIQKVTVHPLEKTHPDIAEYFQFHGHIVLGWFAWKPVAIKQALQLFPYVLWLDAGSEVRNRLDHLFEYIRSNQYFICTIGDRADARGKWLHNVGWGTTSFVKNKFGLDAPEKTWILDQESVMGGVIGVAKEGGPLFIDDLYELSKDLRYYADDGTAPNGWGCARHDQVLLSYFAYSRNLTVHKQDGIHGNPIPLPIENRTIPFYITWDKAFVHNATEVFNCRTDKSSHPYHYSKIRMRNL